MTLGVGIGTGIGLYERYSIPKSNLELALVYLFKA